MSFATEVKAELLRVESDKYCCMRSQLAAVLRMSGDFVIKEGRAGINFNTENAALARQVLKTVKTQFYAATEVVVTRSTKLKKTNRYQIKIIPTPEALSLIEQLQLNLDNDGRLERTLLLTSCCRKAFLRGAFLASGSVNKPESDYHLEIVSSNENFAHTILRLMKYFDLNAKMVDRKQEYIVYLKEGDAVTGFLSVIGAHNCLMDFENVRIVKQLRNQANRITNCETANIDKTIKAAVRQVAGIKYLQKMGVFENLPYKLKNIAELRLQYPESNLTELASLYHSNISKSGLNHRLKKLEIMANELGMENIE